MMRGVTSHADLALVAAPCPSGWHRASHHHGQRRARPLPAIVEERDAERVRDVERLVRALRQEESPSQET